ncbi:tyrosine-type recombinase/integrase [Halomonas sp. M20]|nr:site-specific integrase [Halomonas sp. M20]
MRKILRSTQAANIRDPAFKRAYKCDDAGMPLILDNAGYPFWPFIDYLLRYFGTGTKAVGSLQTYAANLSLFVQYLDSLRLPLVAIDGQTMVDFRNHLLRDKTERSNNQINTILRRCFHALSWLQRRHYFGDSLVIGTEDPAQIVIGMETYQIRTKRGAIAKSTFAHASLLPVSARVPRFPVSSETIEALWNAIPRLGVPGESGKFRRDRMKLLLSCAEQTGARRIELSRLTVKDIEEAKRRLEEQRRSPESQQSVRVAMTVAKSGIVNDERVVAFAPELIMRAIRWIKGPRKRAILRGKTNGIIDADPGLLFVASDGRSWATRSFSDEVLQLKKLAGLHEPAHLHLLRHNWIDILACAYALDTRGSAAAQAGIGVRLMSQTGHKSMQGVAPYLHMAHEKAGYFSSAERMAYFERQIAAFSHELQGLRNALESATSLEEAKLLGRNIDTLLSAAKETRPIARIKDQRTPEF